MSPTSSSMPLAGRKARSATVRTTLLPWSAAPPALGDGAEGYATACIRHKRQPSRNLRLPETRWYARPRHEGCVLADRARCAGAGRLRQRAPGRGRARGRVHARGRRRVVPGAPVHRPARATMRLAVRNTDDRELPNLAVTIDDRAAPAATSRRARSRSRGRRPAPGRRATSRCGSSTAGPRAARPPPRNTWAVGRDVPRPDARARVAPDRRAAGHLHGQLPRVARPRRQGGARQRPAHDRLVPTSRSPTSRSPRAWGGRGGRPRGARAGLTNVNDGWVGRLERRPRWGITRISMGAATSRCDLFP